MSYRERERVSSLQGCPYIEGFCKSMKTHHCSKEDAALDKGEWEEETARSA